MLFRKQFSALFIDCCWWQDNKQSIMRFLLAGKKKDKVCSNSRSSEDDLKQNILDIMSSFHQ